MPQYLTIVDPLSATSLRVTPKFNTVELASATAFTIAWGGRHYLVTNWHVLAGRDADTGECLDTRGAIPNKLSVNFHARGKLGTWRRVELDLLDAAEQPLWLEHPLGKFIDVAAIPLQEIPDVEVHPLDLTLAEVDMIPIPALPISVIGYPLGLAAGESWPIWKTGHIASDPDIDFQPNRPAFLIDATTRSGMSGSPVVLRQTSYMGKSSHVLASGVITKFMGVYSGRIHKDVEVGRVWRPFVISEVLQEKLVFNEQSRRIQPSRMAPCPCLSNKRFKECCGKLP